MTQPSSAKPDTLDLIRTLHERPQMPLAEWLRAPAHVHYKAFRMNDPPAQRPASREEFLAMLEAFQVPSESRVIRDGFGYGVKVAPTGDRLIFVWQGHTEYYSYQVWHVPPAQQPTVRFGPMAYPQFRFPISPLGTEVCRLDIVLTPDPLPERDDLRELFPGPVVYGSRILDADTSLVTSFTHDEHGRERYWVSVGATRIRAAHQFQRQGDVVGEGHAHVLGRRRRQHAAPLERIDGGKPLPEQATPEAAIRALP